MRETRIRLHLQRVLQVAMEIALRMMHFLLLNNRKRLLETQLQQQHHHLLEGRNVNGESRIAQEIFMAKGDTL